MVRHRECRAYVPKTAYSRPGADATPLQNGGAPLPLRQQSVPLGPDHQREEAHTARPLRQVADLTTWAEEQVNTKRAFEETCLEGQRQFHGQSNGTGELELKQANKSGVVVALAALLGRQAAREILSTHLQKENVYVDGEV